LSAAEIQIDALTLSDGTVLNPQSPGSWSSMVALNRYGNEPYRGDVSIDTGLEVERQKLRSLAGRVLWRAPMEVQTVSLSTAEIGVTVETVCGPITLADVSKRYVVIEGTGDAACMYAAHALGTNGLAFSSTDASFQKTPNGWSAKLTTNGVPAKLELSGAKDMEHMEFPFAMAISAGEK
jgi:hypothetical protein